MERRREQRSPQKTKLPQDLRSPDQDLPSLPCCVIGVNWCLHTDCGTCTTQHLIMLLNSNNYFQYEDRNAVIEILEDAVKYKEK